MERPAEQIADRFPDNATENSLRALVEATQDAVIFIDRQACIVIFNPAAERIFGYSQAEALGQKVNMLMAEPYAGEHDQYIEHYEKTGEKRAIGYIRTVAGKRRNGEIFPIELSVTQVATGAEVNYAAFIRDVSDKAKHLRDLAENARLASIGATVTKLTHELGSPLNGMYITAQLLERLVNKQTSLPDAKITATVNSLYREIQRLNSLLIEFRSVSHAERFDFKPVSLPMVIGEVLSLERPHYINRGVHINQIVPTDLPSVVADADKLKQVILNLCNNAVDAMPNGGELTLRATGDDHQAIIEVADTGDGIPEGVDIWAPFVTTKSTGTGLGLMIAQNIIVAHQGTIDYRTEVGKGTTFRLTLPLHASRHPATI
ncbi:MAG TPA: PAS domain S-box protein [Pyrinomonadaceae bacterium]|nr:PAS domain S-box protein [Pyrinomonadaceae bacterium]